MRIRLDKEITLFGDIPKPLMIDIKKDLVFDNPVYLEATQAGRLTKGMLKRIKLVKKNKFRGRVSMPKGYYYKLIALLKKHKIEKQILDNQSIASLLPVNFKGKLERDQLRAGMLIKKKDYGVFRSSTGSGKTITALWVIAERGVATLILVHTRELLYQWRDKIKQFLDYEAGLVGNGHREYKPITVAIKNSLIESPIEREFGMLIVDECFASGTLIDGKPIERIKVGDSVYSYNHKENRVEKKKVLKVFKNKPSSLCTVKIKNKKPIICTEGHPFYTQKRKYLTSKELNSNIGNTVLSIDYHLLKLRRIKNAKNRNDKVLHLWRRGKMSRKRSLEKLTSKSKRRDSLLFRGVYQNSPKEFTQKICKVFKKIQQKVCLRKNEEIQSYVQEKKHRKDEINKTSKWDFKYLDWQTWREWSIHTTSNIISCCIRMGNGSSNKNRKQTKRWQWLSYMLQSRHRKQKTKNSYRNRRQATQGKKSKSTRPEKRKETNWDEVENIKIHKRGSDGTFGEVCKDGYVYNIEVKDNNNYFANGVLVHNCHHAPAETFAEVIGQTNTKYLLGLTATTKRSDGLDKLIYYYMGDLVHSIEAERLEKLGRIIKPELRVIQTNFSYYIKSVYQRPAMIQSLTKDKDRNTLITYHVNKQLDTYKGVALIISDRKSHCETLQELLLDNQIKAEILMSSVSAKQRREVVERLQAGESEALVATSQLIGEGFDLPSLSSIFLTMPIKFDGRLQQYIGRIVRVAEGKTKAIIYDFSDKCWLLQHSLKRRMEYYKSVGIETL